MSCADHRWQHSFHPAVWPWENRVTQSHLPSGTIPRPLYSRAACSSSSLLEILPSLLVLPPDACDSGRQCIPPACCESPEPSSESSWPVATHVCDPVTPGICHTRRGCFCPKRLLPPCQTILSPSTTLCFQSLMIRSPEPSIGRPVSRAKSATC